MDITNIFTVSPMNQKITLNPGEVYEGSIFVSNPATATDDFAYNIEVMPYGVDEKYDANFIAETKCTEITKWIVIKEPNGIIKPNEVKTIEFEIHTPVDAGAGGQYAALAVSLADTGESRSGLNVNSKFEMASLIYGEVTGNIVHDGSIVNISVPGFTLNLPITTFATLKNNGNIYETAKIGVKVKSVFSPETIYPKEGESGVIEEVVMPETEHEYTRDIINVSPLGIYDVEQIVTYMGETSTIKQTVVVCPLWFIMLASVTVLAIIVFIIKSILRCRRRHRLYK